MRPPVRTKSSCSYIVGRRYFAASSTSLALCELKNADARTSSASARALTAASKALSNVLALRLPAIEVRGQDGGSLPPSSPSLLPISEACSDRAAPRFGGCLVAFR